MKTSRAVVSVLESCANICTYVGYGQIALRRRLEFHRSSDIIWQRCRSTAAAAATALENLILSWKFLDNNTGNEIVGNHFRPSQSAALQCGSAYTESYSRSRVPSSFDAELVRGAQFLVDRKRAPGKKRRISPLGSADRRRRRRCHRCGQVSRTWVKFPL